MFSLYSEGAITSLEELPDECTFLSSQQDTRIAVKQDMYSCLFNDYGCCYDDCSCDITKSV